MESHIALDDYDTERNIRQYLERSEQSVHCDGPNELSFPARLCSESLELFQEILHRISTVNDQSLPRSEYISLERSFSQFKLWSDGYGALNGELDKILHRSTRLRRDVLRLLRSIAVTLTERLVPQLFSKSSMTYLGRSSIELQAFIEAYHGDDDESTSSGGSIDSLEDNIQEMTKDLQTDTLCLMELGDSLEDPILDSIKETERSPLNEALVDWEPHKAFCEKVEVRFPGATELLVLRLGKANYERYIRCQQERETCEQIEVKEDSESQLLHGSMFHDSGLGSSMPSATSYAETLMSYGNTSGRSVRIPPLPVEGVARKPFACFVCGKTVKITNDSAWKRHLYSDLRPWVCLDTSCSCGNTSFKDRSDWTSHLALDHRLEPRWESFKCPLCHAETGTGQVTITRHLGAHLEEISLGALPRNLDCESDSESAKEGKSDHINPRPEDEPEWASLFSPLPSGRDKSLYPGLDPTKAALLVANSWKAARWRSTHENRILAEEGAGAEQNGTSPLAFTTTTLTHEEGEAHMAKSNHLAYKSQGSEFERHLDNDGSTSDIHEPRYCVCNRPAFGDMIGCDNHNCQKEWFHLECIGLMSAPESKEKWFCPDCKAQNFRAKEGPQEFVPPDQPSRREGAAPTLVSATLQDPKSSKHEVKAGNVTNGVNDQPTTTTVGKSRMPTKKPDSGYFTKGVWYCNCQPRLPAVQFQVRKESKNKGRWFYTCQVNSRNDEKGNPQKCNFFLWAEDAQLRKEDDVPDSPAAARPDVAC